MLTYIQPNFFSVHYAQILVTTDFWVENIQIGLREFALQLIVLTT